MSSGPAFLAALPAVGAAIAYLVCRWERLAALVIALVATLATVLLWVVPLEATVSIGQWVVDISRETSQPPFVWALTPTARAFLAFIFATGALASLAAVFVPQGQSFAPMAGLLLAGSPVVALLVKPAGWSPIALAFLAVLSVPLIQGGRVGSVRGAIRWPWLPMIALMPFLIIPWYREQVSLSPGNPTMSFPTARLLGWGILLLLAPAPLHGGRTAMMAEARPVAAALLALVWDGLTLLVVHELLRASPGMVEHFNLAAWLTPMALLTVLWGGVAAFGQRDFARLWGFSALHDYGLLLLAISLGPASGRGWTLVLAMLVTRAATLLLGGAGLAALQGAVENTEFDQVRGLARRLPWTTAATLASGFGLAGLPLTPGFAGRLAVWAAVGYTHPHWQWPLLLAAVLVAVGYWRGMRALVSPLSNPRIPRESLAVALWQFVLLISALALSIAPQIVGAIPPLAGVEWTATSTFPWPSSTHCPFQAWMGFTHSDISGI